MFDFLLRTSLFFLKKTLFLFIQVRNLRRELFLIVLINYKYLHARFGFMSRDSNSLQPDFILKIFGAIILKKCLLLIKIKIYEIIRQFYFF